MIVALREMARRMRSIDVFLTPAAFSLPFRSSLPVLSAVVEARGLATADVAGLKTYCKVKVYGAKKKYKTAELDKTNVRACPLFL